MLDNIFQFHNTWLDVTHIMAVVFTYGQEFSAGTLVVPVQSAEPTVINVVLEGGVVLNLEKEDAKAFAEWWNERR